jgi:TldD protein
LFSQNSVNRYRAAAIRAERLGTYANSDRVKTLALRAIDAAKAAGATYAEARLTRTVKESFGNRLNEDSEELAIGVRALYNRAWGFSSSPYWDLDEAAQLAHDAVAQAKINARLNVRVNARLVDMGHYPVATGNWQTPIRIDPFQISLEEKTDFVRSLSGLIPDSYHGLQASGQMLGMFFQRQERAVATTEGAYFIQTLYQAGGGFVVRLLRQEDGGGRYGVAEARGLTAAGAGWELILDAKIREQIPQLLADAEADLNIPLKPVDVGRYDVVCDAATMASLVDSTLGSATEVDRTMGYEANADGVSYFGPDPFAHLGTAVGTPLLNVTADRSMDRGLATVKWDDEGVVPETFPIVQNGMLVDLSTIREQASWMEHWYTARQQPVRSHGCAAASSAFDNVQAFTPNMTLLPGKDAIGFDELIANTKRGIAIFGGIAVMDFQSRGGTCVGGFREITNGKLGAGLLGAGTLFDSTELWKKLTALGGAESRDVAARGESKGQPVQYFSRNVVAVPGSLKEMAIIDIRRKA